MWLGARSESSLFLEQFEGNMATQPAPFTKEGYERLGAELHRLKSEERPRVIADIAEARAHGDLS